MSLLAMIIGTFAAMLLDPLRIILGLIAGALVPNWIAAFACAVATSVIIALLLLTSPIARDFHIGRFAISVAASFFVIALVKAISDLTKRSAKQGAN